MLCLYYTKIVCKVQDITLRVLSKAWFLVSKRRINVAIQLNDHRTVDKVLIVQDSMNQAGWVP